MTRTNRHTTADGLADTLRDLADLLDKTFTRTLDAPVWLTIGFQVDSFPANGSTKGQRAGTVDILANLLGLSAPSATERGQYSTGSRELSCGASVTAYTGRMHGYDPTEARTVIDLATEYKMQPHELRAFADLGDGHDYELLDGETVKVIREAIAVNPSMA